MSLDMFGHIDDTFQSVPATRFTMPGGYVNGIWVDGGGVSSSHKVTLQPLSEKELQNLIDTMGSERILDSRKIYINDGSDYNLVNSDEWQFVGVDGRFKTFKVDNRKWRNYAKVIVYRIDDGVEV